MAKYVELWFKVRLQKNETLQIVVADSWRHRFLMIKSVSPNGVGSLFGLKRGDRIAYVNGIGAPELTLEKFHTELSKRKIILCVLRKNPFPTVVSKSIKSSPMVDQMAEMATANRQLETFVSMANLASAREESSHFAHSMCVSNPDDLEQYRAYVDLLNQRINSSPCTRERSMIDVDEQSLRSWVREECFNSSFTCDDNIVFDTEDADDGQCSRFSWSNKENHPPIVV